MKTELEKINELVNTTVNEFTKKQERLNNIKEALKSNQDLYHKGNCIARKIDNFTITGDAQLIRGVQQSFGDKMLFSLIKKKMPEILEDLKQSIEFQANVINKE